jgi:hypothetical protein
MFGPFKSGRRSRLIISKPTFPPEFGTAELKSFLEELELIAREQELDVPRLWTPLALR